MRSFQNHPLHDLKVALAPPGDFNGTATGKYKTDKDVLYLRATPKVLKGLSSGKYGSPEYILIHELGHRYERFNKLPADFDRPSWWTTRYSQKEGEAFAELFAIGHFGIKGTWDAETLSRFEAVMPL